MINTERKNEPLISDEQELINVFDAVFGINTNSHLVSIFKDLLDQKLSEYSDQYISKSIELLTHWRQDGVDYSKMDKLSIISERSKLL